MLSESLTKTKLTDPLILDLLQNIREHRSMLEDLKSIKIDPKLTNIISKEIGRELYIENEFHKAKGFRKLHIEVAEFSKNLKILHCVFFPDPKFDIPIFGMDLVKINDIVSAAIVDLSPASQNQGLKYEKSLSKVDKSSFTSLREIPNWGEIFSKNVFFASLKSNFSYFKPWFCDAGDKSTMAAETISFIFTKSIPKIGISNFGSGKKTQCNILRFFENSATSICNFLKPFAL